MAWAPTGSSSECSSPRRPQVLPVRDLASREPRKPGALEPGAGVQSSAQGPAGGLPRPGLSHRGHHSHGLDTMGSCPEQGQPLP